MKKISKRTLFAIFALLVVFCFGIIVPILSTNQSFADEELQIISLEKGKLETAYSQSVMIDGHKDSYVYEVKNGLLIDGLELSSAGIISGTPHEFGKFYLDITITDLEDAEFCETIKVCVDIQNTLVSHATEIEEVDYKQSYFIYSNLETTVNKIYYEDNFDNHGKILYTINFFDEDADGIIEDFNTRIVTYSEDGLTMYAKSSSYYNGYIRQQQFYQGKFNNEGMIVELQNISKNDDFLNETTQKIFYEGTTQKRTLSCKETNLDTEEVESYYQESINSQNSGNYTLLNYRYTDNTKTTLIEKNINIKNGNIQSSENWRLGYHDVKIHSKTIETRISENEYNVINIIYENDNWESTIETKRERRESITSYQEPNIKIEEVKYYNSEDVLTNTSKRIILNSSGINGEEIVKTKTYTNGIFNSENIEVNSNYLVIKDEETFLNVLKDYEKVDFYSEKITVDNGVNIVIDEDMELPEGVEITVNNLTIKNDKKLIIPEDSKINITGELVIGNKVVCKGVVYEAGSEILGAHYNPTALIIVLSCVVLIAGTYVTGIFFYKNKKIQWTFLKYIYPFIKF